MTEIDKAYERGFKEGLSFCFRQMKHEHDKFLHFQSYHEGYNSLELLRIRIGATTEEEAEASYNIWKRTFRPNDEGKEVGESLPIDNQAFRDPPEALQSQETWYERSPHGQGNDEEDF